MDRLTVRSSDGRAYIKKCEDGSFMYDEIDILDKLADYEDTGYSPKEINEMKDEISKLQEELEMEIEGNEKDVWPIDEV